MTHELDDDTALEDRGGGRYGAAVARVEDLWSDLASALDAAAT